MCTTGFVLVDNLCQLALRTGGIGYLFALALLLTVVAALFLAWRRVEPLVSPYRNEMRMAEYLLFSHYWGKVPAELVAHMFKDYPEGASEHKLSASELQGMWYAIGLGTLSRALVIAAILIPLLLIAR